MTRTGFGLGLFKPVSVEQLEQLAQGSFLKSNYKTVSEIGKRKITLDSLH
ncbi:MAG: hypothetical protein OZ914_05960 [Anaerolineaceae bacterium]|nr:hypothetical protein [Anaerolineaceae bacterium]